MARNKEKKKPKFMRYMNTMFDCGKRVDRDCIVQPQLHKDLSGVNLYKESDNGDIMELIRQAKARKCGGVKVDVDSKGNLVLKTTPLEAPERSYSVGVGRIGKIDEEAPCDFKESDVNKYLYRRCASYTLLKGNVLY